MHGKENTIHLDLFFFIFIINTKSWFMPTFTHFFNLKRAQTTNSLIVTTVPLRTSHSFRVPPRQQSLTASACRYILLVFYAAHVVAVPLAALWGERKAVRCILFLLLLMITFAQGWADLQGLGGQFGPNRLVILENGSATSGRQITVRPDDPWTHPALYKTSCM